MGWFPSQYDGVLERCAAASSSVPPRDTLGDGGTPDPEEATGSLLAAVIVEKLGWIPPLQGE